MAMLTITKTLRAVIDLAEGCGFVCESKRDEDARDASDDPDMRVMRAHNRNSQPVRQEQ